MIQFSKQALIISFYILLGVYFYFLVGANIDLSEKHNFLFMDELVSYYGIYNIHHAKNFTDLVYNIADGGDHRYGRIFWNFSALISLIPSVIWGEQGQIIGTRLANAFLLHAAYFILVRVYLRGHLMRLACFLVLCALPDTVYYSTMPKPEPVQLFFLSIFLYYFNKSQHKQCHWLYFGLSLGAKISSIVLLPYFFIADVVKKLIHKDQNFAAAFSTMTKNGVFMLLGFIIAAPILALGKYQTWYKSTLGNTTHGSDNSSLDWLSWLKFIFNDWIIIDQWLFLITMVCFLLLFFYRTVSIFRRLSLLEVFYRKEVMIVIITAFLFFPIILEVKRLWSFYLHFSAVFFVLSFYTLAQTALKNRAIMTLLLLIVMPLIFAKPMRVNLLAYSDLSERTQDDEFLQQREDFNEIKTTLDSLSRGKKLQVYMDPRLFFVDTNENYDIRHIWGYFLDWQAGRDVIILTKANYGYELPTETNILYQDAVYAKSLLEKHVISNKNSQSTCLSSPCYYLDKQGNDYNLFLKKY